MSEHIDKAVEFLEKMYPDGPWCVCFLKPVNDKVNTMIASTFMPKTKENLKAWLRANDGKYNCYFHTNPVIGQPSKKAKKIEMKSVNYFHVDVDPDKSKNIQDEQTRIYGLFSNRPKGVPRPTALVFSGGGYQAFWKLETPIPLDGTKPTAEEAERYNQQLEKLFKADSCHDVSRVMRLPHTMNLPDKKKVAAGRKPTRSKCIYFKKENVYPIKDFMKAVGVQGKGAKNKLNVSNYSIDIPKDVGRIDDINTIKLPEKLKIAVVNGPLKEEMPYYDSTREDDTRSSWLFEIICSMIRSRVKEDIIFSIITDPQYAISECILEKRNPEETAMRQINNAKMHCVDPRLTDMNNEFTFITSICRIVHEIHNPALNEFDLIIQSVGDFKNVFMNKYVEIEKKKMVDQKMIKITEKKPIGDWWLKQEGRSQCKAITFYPEHETPGYYNLWRGYGVEPSAEGSWEGLKHHILENMCAGNQIDFDYFLDWMARSIQLPAEPCQVAIVLLGNKGTGKSFFAEAFGRLFGRHYLAVSDPKRLVGNFNSLLKDKVLVFADEALFVGDRRNDPIIKTMITEKHNVIEMKGVDAQKSRNCVSLIIASNDDHVIRASTDERRYFALRMSDVLKQNSDYFKAIKKELENGGYEAMLYELMKRDITEFNVRNVPQTKTLHNQKIHSQDPHEQWLFDCLQSGYFCDIHDDHISNEELQKSYVDFCKDYKSYKVKPKSTLGIYLKEVIPSLGQPRPRSFGRKTAGRKVQCRFLPKFDVMRDEWDKFHKTKEDWDDLTPTPMESMVADKPQL